MATFLKRSGPNPRDERGSSTVEAAITIPLVALLVLGSIEFARVMWTDTTIAFAARAGARYAAVRSEDSEDPATVAMIQDTVAAAASGLDPDDLTVTVNWQPSNTQGSAVTVDVVYAAELVLPFLPINSFPLSGRASRVILN